MEENTNPETPQKPENTAVVPGSNYVNPHKKGAWLWPLLLVVALVGGMVGSYVWQNNKLNDLKHEKAALRSQVSSLQGQITQGDDQEGQDNNTDAEAIDPVSPESELLLPGGATADYERVAVTNLFIYRDDIKEIWIEYGEAPDTLDKSTAHTSDEIGLGDAEGFRPYDLFIATTELKPGTRYFYRSAAIYGDKTVYSGVSSFVTKK